MDTQKKVSRIVEPFTIDLRSLFGALFKNIFLILLSAVLFAGAAFWYSANMTAPTYTSSFAAYVVNVKDPISLESLSGSDTTAAQSLALTYAKIISSRTIVEAALKRSTLDCSYDQIKSSVTSSVEEDTQLITVLVTMDSPQDAYELASSIASEAPLYIEEMVEGSSMKIIVAPILPTSSNQSNGMKLTAMGGVLGLFLAAALVILLFLLDGNVKSVEELEKALGKKTMARIPEIDSKEQKLISVSSPADLQESYRTLRSKIMLALPSDRCNVIGVISASASDGKTLTAINLATSMAVLDKYVLLIEGNLRSPKFAELLSIEQKAGITEIAEGLTDRKSAIIHDKTRNLDLYIAGAIPDDPIRVLRSDGMSNILTAARKEYDYVIIDFPAATVTDAAVLSCEVDTYLAVVRDRKTPVKDIRDMIEQIEAAGGSIAGFVYNGEVSR